MTTVYVFDPKTKELVGSHPLGTSPLGKPIRYPKNHSTRTVVALPEAQEGYARCFIDGEWKQVEDHRGEKVYNKETGLEIEVEELGPIPETATTEKPPDETYKYTRRGWEQDATLKAAADKAKAEQDARDAARHRIATSETVDPIDLAVALGLRDPA